MAQTIATAPQKSIRALRNWFVGQTRSSECVNSLRCNFRFGLVMLFLLQPACQSAARRGDLHLSKVWNDLLTFV